ncbi:hypothetical protein Dimus_010802 [Dionaea muscipula]
MTTLPVALGLYGYCYSGHVVFPNIPTSMEKPSQFPVVHFTSFGLCTILYVGVAVIKANMLFCSDRVHILFYKSWHAIEACVCFFLSFFYVSLFFNNCSASINDAPLLKCRELAKDFLVAGTSSKSLYGACEAIFRPDMVCANILTVPRL